jgi:DNA end-binding protein Ku
MPYVEGKGEIDKDDIVKGYEYEKGRHVVLTPDEISAIRIPTKRTIQICEFVDVAEIDPIYYDTPYYAVPAADADPTAYIVFRDALRDSGKVAVGEVVLAGKEHLAALRPCGKGMLMETLRYSNEVRKAHEYFDDIENMKPGREQMALAKSLIKKKSAPFKIEKYNDSYEKALRELIDRKLKKLPIKPVSEEEYDTTNVISLMDALKRSVKGGEKSPVKRATTQKTRPKRKAATKAPAKKRKRA